MDLNQIFRDRNLNIFANLEQDGLEEFVLIHNCIFYTDDYVF